MVRAVFLALLLVGAKGFAQEIPWQEARGQILLATPRLDSEPLARSLWEAAVKRGIKVFVLLDPKEAEAPYAYSASLYFAGIHIRLARVTQQEALIDGKYYGSGNASTFPFRFRSAWAKAPPYTPNIQPQGVTVLPHDPFQQLSDFLRGVMQEELIRGKIAREHSRRQR